MKNRSLLHAGLLLLILAVAFFLGRFSPDWNRPQRGADTSGRELSRGGSPPSAPRQQHRLEERAPAKPSTPPSSTAKATLRCRLWPTGRHPLNGGRVIVLGQDGGIEDSGSVLSGATNELVFEGLSEGIKFIVAAPQDEVYAPATTTVNLSPPETTVDVYLLEAGSLSGNVVSTSGAAVPGAKVTAVFRLGLPEFDKISVAVETSGEYSTSSPKRREGPTWSFSSTGTISKSVLTDAQGRFTITGLPHLAVQIIVEKDGFTYRFWGAPGSPITATIP